MLDPATAREVNDVSPIQALRWPGGPCFQFTVRISCGDASDLSYRVEAENQQMFVGNIETVKRVDNVVVPSFVGLDFAHDTFKEPDALGVYLNPVKGSLDFLPPVPNWEFGIVRDFVGQESANCADPSEIQSTPEIVNRISSNQGQII
jgi:hypothetical protein